MPTVKRIVLDPEIRVRRLTQDGDYAHNVAYIFNTVNQEEKPEPQARGALYFDESTARLYVDTGTPQLGVLAVGFFNEDIFPGNALAISESFSNTSILGYSLGVPVIVGDAIISASSSSLSIGAINVGVIVGNQIVESNTVSDASVITNAIVRPREILISSEVVMSVIGSLFSLESQVVEITSMSLMEIITPIIVKEASVDIVAISGASVIPDKIMISGEAVSFTESQLIADFDKIITGATATSATTSNLLITSEVVGIVDLPLTTSSSVSDASVITNTLVNRNILITTESVATIIPSVIPIKDSGLVRILSFSGSTVESQTVRTVTIVQSVLNPLGISIGTITTTITETVSSGLDQVADIAVQATNSVTGTIQTGVGQIGVIFGSLGDLVEQVGLSTVTITNSVTNEVTNIILSLS